MNLFIIGYMASGKTTFGRALARQVGRQFVDLDFYIEQRFRKSIPQLFAERGESGFRALESAMLREVGEFDDIIISCGGGTPCFGDNMDYMLSRGTVLWLTATPERITERLIINRSKRPLMADKSDDEILAEVRRGLESRLPHYSRAHIRLDGEHLEDRRQIASTVTAFLAAHREHF